MLATHVVCRYSFVVRRTLTAVVGAKVGAGAVGGAVGHATVAMVSRSAFIWVYPPSTRTKSGSAVFTPLITAWEGMLCDSDERKAEEMPLPTPTGTMRVAFALSDLIKSSRL